MIKFYMNGLITTASKPVKASYICALFHPDICW